MCPCVGKYLKDTQQILRHDCLRSRAMGIRWEAEINVLMTAVLNHLKERKEREREKKNKGLGVVTHAGIPSTLGGQGGRIT